MHATKLSLVELNAGIMKPENRHHDGGGGLESGSDFPSKLPKAAILQDAGILQSDV